MGRGVRHDKVERVPKWSREQVGYIFYTVIFTILGKGF